MAPTPLLGMQKSSFLQLSKIQLKPAKYCYCCFFWDLELLQIGALDAPESYPLAFGALGALLKWSCRAIDSVFNAPKATIKCLVWLQRGSWAALEASS